MDDKRPKPGKTLRNVERLIAGAQDIQNPEHMAYAKEATEIQALFVTA